MIFCCSASCLLVGIYRVSVPAPEIPHLAISDKSAPIFCSSEKVLWPDFHLAVLSNVLYIWTIYICKKRNWSWLVIV